MPNKVIDENPNIFNSFLWTRLKDSIKTSKFSQCLKIADITPLYGKNKMNQKERKL